MCGVCFITCQNIVSSSYQTICGRGSAKRTVNCSNHSIQRIPNNIDSTTERLYLNDNKISKLPSKVFQYLRELLLLDLSYNEIESIHETAFYGLQKLSVLNLEYNNITQMSIEHGCFLYFQSLQTLNVRSNPYWTYHMDTDRDIAQITSLEYLKIDVVDKIKLSKQISELRHLKKLDIVINEEHIDWSWDWNFVVRNDSFSELSNSHLHEISLHASYVEPMAFCPLTELKTVRLFVRTEKDISIDAFKPFHCFRNKNMTRIEITGMSYKNSFVLSVHNLKYLADICLKELVLPNNFIRDVSPRYFSVFAEKSVCLELLDLSNNPFYGKMDWLVGALRFQNLRVGKISSVGTVGHMYSPGHFHNHTKLTIQIQNSLEEIYATNIYTPNALPTLNITGARSLKVVNASYVTFNGCYGSLFGNFMVHTLDTSGWRCTKINPRLLENAPHLVNFVARNSYLGIGFKRAKDANILFKNNLNLKLIDLSSNGIRHLPSDMFSFQANSLTNLILHNNSFSEVPIYIHQFSKLLVFDLSFNNFNELSKKDMQKLENKGNTSIRLRGNPFHCLCNNLNFLRWANTSGIKDFSTSTCLTESGAEVPMPSIIGNINKFETKCASKGWIIYAISLSSVVLIIVITAFVYYRYRYTIEYLLIRMRLRLRKYKPLINAIEYPYDAFISHSHNDIDFIMPMYRKLTSMGYNIAIDAKDFIAGRFIAENVVDILEKSKKMIFVITQNFLESQWGSYELEMARMHAFRDDRENMVILIIKDELTFQDMPRALQEMWSKITCIEWPNEITVNSMEDIYNTISLALQN